MSNATALVVLSMVTSGLVLGLIFALVASGVTIVYGSIWLPNAANGQFFLLAALGCWSFVSWGFSLPTAIAAVLVLACSLPISYFLEATLVRRFYDVPDRNISYFVVTLGIPQDHGGAVLRHLWPLERSVQPAADLGGVTFIGPLPDSE